MSPVLTRTSLSLAAAGVVLTSLLLPGCGDDGSSGVGPPDEDRWELVWSDEFEGPIDQSPDPTKWTFDIGTDWGNQQLEWDTDRPENASLDGQGNLRIIARRENFQGQPYTSARMTTEDLFEPTYGRFEARIRMPTGKGLWPAFWLLGANIDQVSWPQSGEIDVVEYIGDRPNEIHGTLHGPGYSGSGGPTKMVRLSNGRFDTSFHTFAVEWEPDEVRWYLDGDEYHSVDPGDVNGEWVFNHPFYIILNVAVGGTWPGSPDGTTQFPQTMLVDYVRVYRRAP